MEEGNLKPVLPERVTPIDRLTIAKYDGQCSRCNLGIHVGQPIVMMSNDTWEHSHHHMAKEVWID